MTTDRACEILGDRNHRGFSKWVFSGKFVHPECWEDDPAFTPDEAIAIAQAYEGPQWRDKPTCDGKWMSQSGNLYSIPLNAPVIPSSPRWYGPIPPDVVKA